MKRGQVTIFIIVGIVLVIGFAFFFFLTSDETTSRFEGSLDDIGKKNFQLQDVFEICAREKLELAADMLFKQGGIIYEDQGGPFERPDIRIFDVGIDQEKIPYRAVENEDLTINYGIRNEVPIIYQVNKNFKQAGAFRGLDSVSDVAKTGIFHQTEKPPYFGTVGLPKLCNRNGPNNPENPDALFTCLPQLYNSGEFDENTTVQSQLNTVLTKLVASCLGEDMITDLFDFEIEGDGSVETTFTQEETVLDINFSLTEQGSGTEKITTPRFTFPLRIKKLYTLGYLMAERDSNDIFFNSAEDYNNITVCSGSCWDPQMQVNVVENFLETSRPGFQRDDLLEIQDRVSEINNPFKPVELDNTEVSSRTFLTFNIPIQNRRPYLETIQDLPLEGEKTGYDYGEAYGLGPSKSVADRTIFFTYKVLDPDAYDADQIYNGVLGSKAINVESARSGSDTPYSGRLSSISVPNQNGPIILSHVLSCTNHCDQREYNTLPFAPTIYTMRATVSDGQYDDFQVFDLTINP